MKQLNLLLACIVLLVFSGLCLYIIFWNPAGMQQVISITLALYASLWGKILILAMGFICLGSGLSLLALFLGIDTSDRPHIILEQEGGAVGVSLDAVEEFIKRKGQSVDGVRDLSVRAEMTEEGISLLTRVTLELHRNVPEFVQSFQSKLHFELIETLGLKKVKDVQVLIHKIVPKEGSESRFLGPPSPVLLKEPEGESLLLDHVPVSEDDKENRAGSIEMEPPSSSVLEEKQEKRQED